MSKLKVSRDEMRRLLGIAPPTPARESAPSALQPVPVPAAAPVASEGPKTPGTAAAPRGILTPVHFTLSRALPRLWHYAQAKLTTRDARTQHQKLCELVRWALSKDGYRVQANVATPYQQDGQTLDGRLELLVEQQPGQPLLALETDWTASAASLLKLEAWHKQGVPTLWVIGRPCKPAHLPRLRKQANRVLGQATGRWLAIFHLEHGWVRSTSGTRR